MKVMHVEAGRHLYGGAQQVAWLIEGLRSRGVDNVLVCPIEAAIAGAVGPNVRTIQMPMRGDLDAALAWRLAQAIRAERPDLVHLHSRRGADLWGGVAARLAGVACVLSRRVDNPESRALVALRYRLYDRVITISEGIRNVLLAEGLHPDQVVCVRSAVDAAAYLAPVERSAFLREFRLPADALVVGIVAQLIERKGHRHLFAAVDALRVNHPRLQVLVFGQGPLRAELEADAARLALGDIVHFAGFRNDLPRWLGGLDILAHPADMEGLGVALLQASAAAVPIVTTRAGGLPEAVADQVSGLLVEPGDPRALADALHRLLVDEKLRRQMGDAGRQRVLAEFSVSAMVDGNLAVYREVLDRRARKSA